MNRYLKPKITTKRCHISFFLSQSALSDSLGYFFGNIADAQSSCTTTNGSNSDCSSISNGGNCNNSCSSNCSCAGGCTTS